MNIDNYTIMLRPLTKEEGGGWLAQVSELPGCMSDGETQEDALRNVREAIASWTESAKYFGKRIPKAGEPSKFVVRLPKSLHQRLASAAKIEGVSLNTQVVHLLAEGLGRRTEHHDFSARAASTKEKKRKKSTPSLVAGEVKRGRTGTGRVSRVSRP
jgi:antitoxin HicB